MMTYECLAQEGSASSLAYASSSSLGMNTLIELELALFECFGNF